MIALFGCFTSGALLAQTSERLSDWLKHSSSGHDSYPLGLMWSTPEALSQQQLEYEKLMQLVSEQRNFGLAKALLALRPTGRVRVAAANSAWLEANPLRDPVLQTTDKVLLPKRPSSLRVMRSDGTVCELEHVVGLWAADYVQACFGDGMGAWAWVVQPDGRVQRVGVSAWNVADQDEPAPGSWVYAPEDSDDYLGDVFHHRWALWLATQGLSNQIPLEAFSSFFASFQLQKKPIPKAPSIWQGTSTQMSHRPTSSNWGNVGVLQTPTARMQKPGYFGLSMHRTYPYSTMNVMLQPHERLELGFRYVDISNRLYGATIAGNQSYKDKSMDLKVTAFKETAWVPEFAVGMRDVGGTGLFSSEYVVASKRRGAWDFSAGLAWGYLGNRANMANPLSSLGGSAFDSRVTETGSGGTLATKAWFRGPTSPFVGAQFETPWHGLVLKAEYDGNNYKNEPLDNVLSQRSPINFGAVFPVNRWVDVSVGYERGNTWALGFRMYTDLSKSNMPKLSDPPLPSVRTERPASSKLGVNTAKDIETHTQWQVADIRRDGTRLIVDADDSYTHYTQLRLDKAMAVLHRDADQSVDEVEIRHRAAGSTLASQNIARDAWVKTQTEPARAQKEATDLWPLVYPKNEALDSGTNTRLNLIPSINLTQTLGGPDGFVLYQISATERMTWKFANDMRLSGAARYRLIDNYENFKYTGPSLLPRVRTYAREFLTTSRLTMPTLNLGKTKRIAEDWYASAYGGYLEEMYGGLGGEVMFRQPRSAWAFAVDWNSVRQRDFHQNFSMREYRANTGHVTAFWETPMQGVQVAVSAGQYLAGDKGVTLMTSKVFDNGSTMGVYATKTNVSATQFGEGSFDKGIFWSLPFDALLTRSSKGSAKFLWTPLTRDGGAKLRRPIELYEETQWLSPNATRYQPASPEKGMSAPDDFVER